jgi:hypothetical protein
MLLANLYLLCWDWDRWKDVLPFTAPANRRHGDALVSFGLLIAAGGGLWSVTQVHLARLRHTTYSAPLVMVAAAGVLGLTMLVIGYRRARR